MATHYAKDDIARHEMEEIIETLASKLYFHGHPINRREAREELKLKVTANVPPQLESAMWKLYKDYEIELSNRITFDPMSDIYNSAPAPVVQIGQIAIIPPGTYTEIDQRLAVVESDRLSSICGLRRRFVVANFDPSGAPQMRVEVLSQGWTQMPAPEPAPAE